MKSLQAVTPQEARAVWSSMPNPSARRVARALSQAGRRVHHSTIARWCAQGWRPVAHRPHPLEGAHQALDLAAGVLTGDPAAGMKLFENHPGREQLDGLSDSEVLRRSARQLCIATILACDAFQESASTLVAESPAEAALLLKALCGAVPAAAAAYRESCRGIIRDRMLTTALHPTIRWRIYSKDSERRRSEVHTGPIRLSRVHPSESPA